MNGPKSVIGGSSSLTNSAILCCCFTTSNSTTEYTPRDFYKHTYHKLFLAGITNS